MTGRKLNQIKIFKSKEVGLMVSLFFLLLILVSLSLALYLVRQEQEIRKEAAPTAVLSLLPAAQTVNPEETFDVQIYLQAGGNPIRGGDISLNFNPAHLEVVDADSTTAGVQLTPGTILPDPWTAVNRADNAAGQVLLSINTFSSFAGEEGVFGTVKFRAKALTSSTEVSFNPDPETKITAVGGESVAAAKHSATYQIELPPTPTPIPTGTPAPTQTPTPTPVPACNHYRVLGGGASPSVVSPGGTLNLYCDAETIIDCLSPYFTPGGYPENLEFLGWSGTRALYTATAPSEPGVYSHVCRTWNWDTGSNCCGNDSADAGTFTVAVPTPTPGRNLVLNPSFENGTADWAFWSEGTQGYQGTVVSGGYPKSDYAYRITTGSDQPNNWGRAACVGQGGLASNPQFQNPSYFADQTLKLSGYIKTSASATGAYFKLSITTPSGGRNTNWTPGATGSVNLQSWQYVEKVMEIPNEVTKIELDGCSAGIAGGQAWFDDLQLVPIPPIRP